MERQDILSVAKKHSIALDKASSDFFEGALLGNGDLGVVACTRPDALVVYFGHNNVWDIRIDESHKEKIGTFQQIWDRICNTTGDVHKEEWYQKYTKKVTASYHDHVYPRPYPASSLYLFFDRKEYEVLGHSLDISSGLLTVTLENSLGEKRFVKLFVSLQADCVFCRTTDAYDQDVSVFYRILLVPHHSDDGLPEYTPRENGFLQLLPFNEYKGLPREGEDKAFSLLYHCNSKTECKGLDSGLQDMTRLTVQMTQGYFEQVNPVTTVNAPAYEEALEAARAGWQKYWERSGIMIEDAFLEHLWYTNIYFIRCVLNQNSRCPGLFGNWMYQNIGTKWHGDYHMNYNTQQIFWGLMSANRLEQHMPYLRLAEDLLPVSKAWAKDFYQLKGACFPHSAYPVPMTVMPYPSPDWGWEIFETPWTVQSLWWHYTYTGDKELLRSRIYPVLKEAALFLVGYITREGANPVHDNKYHLFPTIVPELYGLTEGLRLNMDGTVDLTLTKFLFHAILQAAQDLEIEEQETELLEGIRKILSAYPEYPTAHSRWGEVYVSVSNEDPDKVVYNCPANLMQVFPGEDIDTQHGTEREREIAKRSWMHHYNEGGNDLVFYHLIGARLGILNLEKFKRHVRYCLLSNETATDNVTLSGDRYPDTMDFKYMERMGIWVENFALYSVVNECLLRGHTDLLEVFPGWDKNKRAAFCSLRTKGAFLVDAECAGGSVKRIRVFSERGGILRIKNPWNQGMDQNGGFYRNEIMEIPMAAGQEVILKESL